MALSEEEIKNAIGSPVPVRESGPEKNAADIRDLRKELEEWKVIARDMNFHIGIVQNRLSSLEAKVKELTAKIGE